MRLTLALVAALGLTTLLTLSLQGQQVHSNAFEAREPVWQKGPADVSFREQVHELTKETAKSGQQSEHIQVVAGEGTYLYYVYPVGRADLVEELIVKAYIRANRPGTQLLARLVLPRERDPNNLDQPLTTLLRGDTYQLTARWQSLEVRGAQRLVQQQQQLMRAELKRDVNFDGAYIDQVMLNIYSGKGQTDVWIDDLEVGPIVDDLAPWAKTTTQVPAAPVKIPAEITTDPKPARHARVELNQERLQVNKQPFFVRGIRHSDTPLKALRDAGFNTIWFDYTTHEEAFEEAVNLGFWLVPTLPVLENNPRLSNADGLAHEVARFAHNDAVLFWDVGSGLTAEQAEAIGKGAYTIRTADPFQGRPVSGDIWDGFPAYSRHLDMVGVHRWPLMTGLDLNHYRDWLAQRRYLSRPGTFMWTWIQTHLPDWYLGLVYDQSSKDGFDEPIGPQPEQIRLLTYISISAGYRGLGFWSDRFLANSHQGRDRLLMLALLNQELEMLEPLLAKAGQPTWIGTKHPEVKAAVFRYDGGTLVLPIWLGDGAQFVPGQLAAANLEMVIPEAPQDAQVWEVSPGHVRSLKRERTAGGVKVVIPEFGLTTALVFTSDINTIAALQQGAAKTRRLAAQWSYDLANEELTKVEKVYHQLESMGQALPDGRALLEDARLRLTAARQAWQQGTQSGSREAYAEAQRALRPLRILMRAEWEKAVKPLDTPVASPYAVSFFTLPWHWQFVDEIKSSQPGNNLVSHGDFEVVDPSWTNQEVTLDDVNLQVGQADDAEEGSHCLKLEVKPRSGEQGPGALERTFLAVHSPVVQAQPGSIVRISGWVKVPKPIQASADGVLFFDSIAGEQLGVRLTQATPWKKFTLYRRVPANGAVGVSMALTGIGTAYFDDVRIEPMLKSEATTQLTENQPLGGEEPGVRGAASARHR